MNREDQVEKLIAAIETIDRLHCLSDAIYDVRENEGQGWEGPEVLQYSAAVKSLREALAELRLVKSKCDTCGQGGTVEPHVCPFKEEVTGDTETLCNCCDDCKAQCADDI